jgi:hypothetical protein
MKMDAPDPDQDGRRRAPCSDLINPDATVRASAAREGFASQAASQRQKCVKTHNNCG